MMMMNAHDTNTTAIVSITYYIVTRFLRAVDGTQRFLSCFIAHVLY